MIRKIKGWCVALVYVVCGCRLRCLKKYMESGTVLSLFGHEASLNTLEPILSYLSRKGFRFISTDELLAIKDGRQAWRQKLAWLTYDDGWSGMGALLPILEKYDVPVTIFISPEETRRQEPWSFSCCNVEDVNIRRRLMDMPAGARYAVLDAASAKAGKKLLLAGVEELVQLGKHPLVTIENHTNTHLSCSHRPCDEVVSDVQAAKDWLGTIGLSKSRLICYPFGHYTEQVDNKLRALGYVPVRSDAGVMTIQTVGMHRNAFHQHVSFQENIGRILGAWPASRLKHS